MLCIAKLKFKSAFSNHHSGSSVLPHSRRLVGLGSCGLLQHDFLSVPCNECLCSQSHSIHCREIYCHLPPNEGTGARNNFINIEHKSPRLYLLETKNVLLSIWIHTYSIKSLWSPMQDFEIFHQFSSEEMINYVVEKFM